MSTEYPHQIVDEPTVGMGYFVDNPHWCPIDHRKVPIDRLRDRFLLNYKLWRMCKIAGISPAYVVISMGSITRNRWPEVHKWFFMPTSPHFKFEQGVRRSLYFVKKYLKENDMTQKKMSQRKLTGRQRRFLIAVDLLSRVQAARKICASHRIPLQVVEQRLAMDMGLLLKSEKKGVYYAKCLTSLDMPEEMDLVHADIKELCRAYNVMCTVIDGLVKLKMRGADYDAVNKRVNDANPHKTVLSRLGVEIEDIEPEHFDADNPFL